jgi:hypothetical protein
MTQSPALVTQTNDSSNLKGRIIMKTLKLTLVTGLFLGGFGTCAMADTAQQIMQRVQAQQAALQNEQAAIQQAAAALTQQLQQNVNQYNSGPVNADAPAMAPEYQAANQLLLNAAAAAAGTNPQAAAACVQAAQQNQNMLNQLSSNAPVFVPTPAPSPSVPDSNPAPVYVQPNYGNGSGAAAAR